jgi:hypothetical protein
MLNQLLWVETLLKLSAAAALLLAPGSVARLLGLPLPGTPFWPRLLGSVLLGLGIASYLHGTLPGGRGLAPAGAIAVNLSAAAVITTMLVMRRGLAARRGRLVLWTTVTVLVLLSLLEISVA